MRRQEWPATSPMMFITSDTPALGRRLSTIARSAPIRCAVARAPAAGDWVKRADPMARYTEVPPATASVVGQTLYEWGDSEWMTTRAQTDPQTLGGPNLGQIVVHLKPRDERKESADEIITRIDSQLYGLF